MITWAYGVTTVAERIKNGLLERTLASLDKAGFTDPWLFVDGAVTLDTAPPMVRALNHTCHYPALRIYGNFHLALSELFIRNTQADRYAIFQDDFVTYRNLRQFLELSPYPTKGYLNLYLFDLNQRKAESQGWYLSNQLGKGAVALVFDNEACQALLKSSYWIGRPASTSDNPNRLWKLIDGGIVEAMRLAGFKEYIHMPSLTQHTGDRSSLGNGKHAHASTFLGEDYDAMNLLPKGTQIPVEIITSGNAPRKPRIGLVGFHVDSGLGELNRQIAKYADVYRWLIKPHPKFGMKEPPDDVDCMVCPTGVKVTEFVKSVDVVVFCERPYYDNLVETCRRLGKRIVCIPMMEWMPPGAKGWPMETNLFLCPTEHCYDQFAHVIPCVHFPWPTDPDHFIFKQRTVCERFLFLNGHGGWHGRKGGDVVREALKLWPEMPLLVRDQMNGNWGNAKRLGTTKCNSELYNEGDVLISPHSVDGIGLEAHEAMTCGMPVITTNGRPWNEIPALERIDSMVEKRRVERPVDWYTPSVQHLVKLCKTWHGKEIIQASQSARDWAMAHSWATMAEPFNDLVRYGKAVL
jgi:hypothetical protein